jgi:hypothetical protein
MKKAHKEWYERSEYRKKKLLTPEDCWERVWNKFQEIIERSELDNSTGDYNYLIGRFIFESGSYDEEIFVKTIKRYLKELQ